MEFSPDSEDRIVRYLLGELTDREAQEIEHAYFNDDEYFESIEGLEAELLRNFVTEQMAPDLRQRFHQRYESSPGLLNKLEFARASASASTNLRASAGGNRDSFVLTGLRAIASLFQVPAFQFALTTVALTTLTAAVFFWRENSHLKAEIGQLVQEHRSIAEPQPSPVNAPSATPREPLLLSSFVLSPGVSRAEGGEIQTITVPRGIGLVRFKLSLPPGIHYRSYRTILQKLPNNESSSHDVPSNAVIDSGRSLIDYVPSVSLRPGRYLLYVKGEAADGELEDVQYYSFFVKN